MKREINFKSRFMDFTPDWIELQVSRLPLPPDECSNFTDNLMMAAAESSLRGFRLKLFLEEINFRQLD